MSWQCLWVPACILWILVCIYGPPRWIRYLPLTYYCKRRTRIYRRWAEQYMRDHPELR